MSIDNTRRVNAIRCIFLCIGAMILIVDDFKIWQPYTKDADDAARNRKSTMTISESPNEAVDDMTTTPSTTQSTPEYTDNSTLGNVSGIENNELLDDEYSILALSSCFWDPFNHSVGRDSCMERISKHINMSLSGSRAKFLKQQGSSAESPINRRWLLLGDSTIGHTYEMFRSYVMDDSWKEYTNSISQNDGNLQLDCARIFAGRCDKMDQFQFQRLPNDENQTWMSPNFARGEGPILHGLENPYCTDCSGCDSEIRSCTATSTIHSTAATNTGVVNSTSSTSSFVGPSYGELQTKEYGTTQENILLKYVANQWNAPIELLHEFGRPICVVGAGHHDAAIPNITMHVFLQNVQWYLDLLVQQCDYIIWISNNSPLTDDYEQKINATYDWNIGVRDLVLLVDLSAPALLTPGTLAPKPPSHI